MTAHGCRSPSPDSHEWQGGLRPFPGLRTDGSGLQGDAPVPPAASDAPDDAAAPGRSDGGHGAAAGPSEDRAGCGAEAALSGGRSVHPADPSDPPGGGGPRVAGVPPSAAAPPEGRLGDWKAPGGVAPGDRPGLGGGQLHTEDEADRLSTLVVALAEGRPVTTSRPAPGRLRAAYRGFEDAGFEAVVSVHLSGELSGTVGAARIARQDIGIPVRIVDTRSAGLAQGLGVRAALEAAASGEGIDDVARAATEAAERAQVLIQVRSLDTLRRGGRVNPTTAMVGTMLQIKPLLSLAEGKIVTVERPVSLPRAKQRFMALAGEALEHSEAQHPVLCVHHVADPHGAREIGEVLVDRHRPDAELVVSELPPVLSAHVGLGTKAAIVEGPTSSPVAHGVKAPQPGA
ncbi:DegV family protein [Kocuria rhizophila]|uniref:DegV family protein n=1 Tax=Kocuria rhizophila TaxID=72000 RepID=UPI00190C8C60|nr:DegV family protein [Kocuria rhizophila]MBK4120165.1 DegV family protein [Kocuria rhizophila]